MNWINTFSAIIFDGDGVLFDSEELTLDAFSHAMAHWGLSFAREELNPWVGVATPKILEQIAREMDVHIPVQEFISFRDAAYLDICRAHGGPLPRRGVDALLDWMDRCGMPRAIGSNANRGKMMFNLEQTGLDRRIPVRYSVDDVEHGKPHPEMFLRAAEQMGVEPKRCLVVEDAVSGLRAARKAGMTAIAVMGSLPIETLEAEADVVFADPAALHEAVVAVRGTL
ncbi:HAD-IA family hydrolase [bacterium]|nr:HAD-IA family hydrolase [bacterium]